MKKLTFLAVVTIAAAFAAPHASAYSAPIAGTGSSKLLDATDDDGARTEYFAIIDYDKRDTLFTDPLVPEFYVYQAGKYADWCYKYSNFTRALMYYNGILKDSERLNYIYEERKTSFGLFCDVLKALDNNDMKCVSRLLSHVSFTSTPAWFTLAQEIADEPDDKKLTQKLAALGFYTTCDEACVAYMAYMARCKDGADPKTLGFYERLKASCPYFDSVEGLSKMLQYKIYTDDESLAAEGLKLLRDAWVHEMLEPEAVPVILDYYKNHHCNARTIFSPYDLGELRTYYRNLRPGSTIDE